MLYLEYCICGHEIIHIGNDWFHAKTDDYGTTLTQECNNSIEITDEEYAKISEGTKIINELLTPQSRWIVSIEHICTCDNPIPDAKNYGCAKVVK